MGLLFSTRRIEKEIIHNFSKRKNPIVFHLERQKKDELKMTVTSWHRFGETTVFQDSLESFLMSLSEFMFRHETLNINH